MRDGQIIQVDFKDSSKISSNDFKATEEKAENIIENTPETFKKGIELSRYRSHNDLTLTDSDTEPIIIQNSKTNENTEILSENNAKLIKDLETNKKE